jgi:Ca2+-transporting ATPase
MARALVTLGPGPGCGYDRADPATVIKVRTVGVVQEIKAGQAIAALSDLTAPEARVLRDGEQRQIPAAEVVTGEGHAGTSRG